MNRYGVLGDYLPAFGKIIGQMQYDLFHVYTVDQHTLFVIRNICRFSQAKFRGYFPLCAEIIETISKPELLYLAALFHDISKGSGGDHSTLGGEEAYHFCMQHDLPTMDTELIAWLVKNHLLMSMTAQREDIHDPSTIQLFAEKMGDLRHLDHLYLLTVADICGTNPSLWNSWKDSLLKELYHQTKQLFIQQNKIPTKEEWIQEKKSTALTLIKAESTEMVDATIFWQSLPSTYFLQETSAHIAWHTLAILTHHDPKTPLVLIKTQKQSTTDIVIYTPYHQNLFTISTTVIANHHLNILEARLNRVGNTHLLVSYSVIDNESISGTTAEDLEHLKQELIYHHTNNANLPRLLNRRKPRHFQHFPLKSKIVFTEDIKRNRTIMEFTTLDRPGLLARIGRIFIHCEILLHHAKIITMGETVEDRFFITDKNNNRIEDQKLLDQLSQQVLQLDLSS